MKILAKIAYDGSAFCGFAKQPNGLGVENKILEILASFGVKSKLSFAGRTDKAVSASAQFVCFEAQHLEKIFECDKSKLLAMLNKKAYAHIKFLALYGVSDDFHARFCAKWREYRYIACKEFVSPFLSRYVSKEDFGDFEQLKKALKLFRGRHNFKFFKKVGSENSDCNITRARLEMHSQNDERQILKIICYKISKIGDLHRDTSKDFLIINVRGNGFLRSQVRLMLGAAFACARGEISLRDLQAQIDAKHRVHSMPASPNGLSLKAVRYCL